MPLIKHHRLSDDPWVSVADDAELPDGTPIIVSLERWRAERDALIGRGGGLGIRLAADQSADDIADELSDVLEDDPDFRSKIIQAAMGNEAFKSRLVKKLAEEVADND